MNDSSSRAFQLRSSLQLGSRVEGPAASRCQITPCMRVYKPPTHSQFLHRDPNSGMETGSARAVCWDHWLGDAHRSSAPAASL